MRRPILLTAILAAALALPAAALANATDRIVQDCQHSQTGALTGTYTKAQLRKALHNLPGDVREYSSCYDQIRQALLAIVTRRPGDGGGNGDGPGGSGGGTFGGGANGLGGGATAPPTVAHVGTRAPVQIDGGTVQPGTIPAIGRDAHELPTALVVPLALLCAGALAAVMTTLGRRVLAHRRA